MNKKLTCEDKTHKSASSSSHLTVITWESDIDHACLNCYKHYISIILVKINNHFCNRIVVTDC